jgi:DNA-binding transcriptional MocR family regulator
MSSSIDIPSTERDSLDLQKGWPSLDLLPLSKIQAASSAIFSDPPTALAALQYGTLLGDSRLRKNLAEWLTKFYSVQRSPDPKRICITGGASQNFTSILQRFADPTYTRNVWMAAPTYFLASRMLEDAGYKGKLRAVPQADEGMDVNYLRQELARTEEFAPARPTANSISKPSSQYPKIYRHLIYAVPTFSNPTSLTMSLDRRQRLVRIAREFDALIVTDDVYDFLQWATNYESGFDPTRSILPRIVDIDSELDGGPERAGSDGFGNAVSNGSFSKIVGPGCRTGWAEGTEKLIDSLSQV